MLYPCGELAANKDTMITGLAQRGIGCESVPVYKTESNPELKIILARLFNEKVEINISNYCGSCDSKYLFLIIFRSTCGPKCVYSSVRLDSILSYRALKIAKI